MEALSDGIVVLYCGNTPVELVIVVLFVVEAVAFATGSEVAVAVGSTLLEVVEVALAPVEFRL